MATGSIGWLAILVLHAPGENLLQQSRVLFDPLLAGFSLYLFAASLFGVFYAARTVVGRTPESRPCFWLACALLAWLATQILVAGQILLVLHLPPSAFVLYAARPRAGDAAQQSR